MSTTEILELSFFGLICLILGAIGYGFYSAIMDSPAEDPNDDDYDNIEENKKETKQPQTALFSNDKNTDIREPGAGC